MTVRVMPAEAIEAINVDQANWDELLVRVGEDRMEQMPFIGPWTFKDFVGHINGWRLRTIARIEAAAKGEPEPPDPWPAGLEDVDAVNAWIGEQYRGRTLADVLEEASTAYIRLRSAVAAHSPDELNDPGRFPWLEGQSLGIALVNGSLFSHLQEEHGPDVDKWLLEQGTRSRLATVV